MQINQPFLAAMAGSRLFTTVGKSTFVQSAGDLLVILSLPKFVIL
jgi:hypothetical protein